MIGFSHDTKQIYVRMRKTHFLMVFLDFSSIFILFVSTQFKKIVFFRVGLGIQLIRILYAIYAGKTLCGRLISDMRIRGSADELSLRISKKVKTLKRIMYSVLSYNILLLSMLLFAVVSDVGLRLMKYFFPGIFIAAGAMALTVLISYQENKVDKLKQMASPKKSSLIRPQIKHTRTYYDDS
eukprot:snap_masked-scaffold_21-processed-gene-5.57-mRNA-1 protein AED:1.00 eAED:1.00 QI:0/0/0/0/1/1/2/0/181